MWVCVAPNDGCSGWGKAGSWAGWLLCGGFVCLTMCRLAALAYEGGRVAGYVCRDAKNIMVCPVSEVLGISLCF